MEHGYARKWLRCLIPRRDIERIPRCNRQRSGSGGETSASYTIRVSIAGRGHDLNADDPRLIGRQSLARVSATGLPIPAVLQHQPGRRS
jgi:hypothetical protein